MTSDYQTDSDMFHKLKPTSNVVNRFINVDISFLSWWEWSSLETRFVSCWFLDTCCLWTYW